MNWKGLVGAMVVSFITIAIVARVPMLKAGIALYELKSSADADFRRKKRSLYRSKYSTSLHTKAFAVDDKYTFIGSYNVDPRSANINT